MASKISTTLCLRAVFSIGQFQPRCYYYYPQTRGTPKDIDELLFLDIIATWINRYQENTNLTAADISAAIDNLCFRNKARGNDDVDFQFMPVIRKRQSYILSFENFISAYLKGAKIVIFRPKYQATPVKTISIVRFIKYCTRLKEKGLADKKRPRPYSEDEVVADLDSQISKSRKSLGKTTA